jgi:hypothetical protein
MFTILSRNPFLGLDSAHSRGRSRPDQPQFNLNSADLAWEGAKQDSKDRPPNLQIGAFLGT